MRDSITARFATVSLMTTLGVLFGCFKPDLTDPAATASSRFLFVMTSPASTAVRDTVDVLIDGKVLGTGIRYLGDGGASTGYLPAPIGSHTVSVVRSRTQTQLLSATIQVIQGTDISVLAVDSVSKLSLLALNDTLTVPDSGKARLRIVHASPNGTAWDFTIVNSATDSVTVPNKSFKEFTAFLTLPSSTTAKTIRVKRTGTSTVVSSGTATLASRRVYTLLIRGFVGGTSPNNLTSTLITNL